jgi:hypothetical protein
MNTLKKVCAVLVLAFAVAVGTATGQTTSATCAPPQPGISETPPCASAPASSDDSSNAGTEFSFTDLALDVIDSALLFF